LNSYCGDASCVAMMVPLYHTRSDQYLRHNHNHHPKHS
jgi:hypothetical protein